MSCKYCTEYEDLPEHVLNHKFFGKVFDTSIQEDENGWHIELPSGNDIGIKFCPYCGRELLRTCKEYTDPEIEVVNETPECLSTIENNELTLHLKKNKNKKITEEDCEYDFELTPVPEEERTPDKAYYVNFKKKERCSGVINDDVQRTDD
jgi:hypothetical protein